MQNNIHKKKKKNLNINTIITYSNKYKNNMKYLNIHMIIT